MQDGSRSTARKLSRSTPKRWSSIAEALLEREVLDGSEVRQLIDGETLAPVAGPKETPGGQTSAGDPAGRRPPRARSLEGERPQPA